MNLAAGDQPSPSDLLEDAARERKRVAARDRYLAKKAKYTEITENLFRVVTAVPRVIDTIETPAFKEIFGYASPGMKMPTRYDVERTAKTKLLGEAKESLKKRFPEQKESFYVEKKRVKVSLLVDQWTRKKGRQTLTCVDVVYRENERDMKKESTSVVIPVPPVKGRLTPAMLKDQLQKVIEDYKLDVTAIITDTSSVVRETVREMRVVNLRCAAHELHLSITESLSKWPLSAEIQKLTDFADHLNHSSTLRKTYFKFCEDLSLPLIGPPFAMADRWQPLYDILKVSLAQWGAINATLELIDEPSFPFDLHPLFTSLLSLLEPFNKCYIGLATACFTEVPHLFSSLISHLNSFISIETGPTLALARLLLVQLETRLSSYLSDSSLLPFFLFDPRFVQSHPEIDWTPITRLLLSQVVRCLFSSFINERDTLKYQLDAYLAEIKDHETIEFSMPLREYWESSGLCGGRNRELATNRYLQVPAATVSARRVFAKTGLLSKRSFPKGVSEAELEARLLMEIDGEGARARSITFLPSPLLVPSLESMEEDQREGRHCGWESGESEGEMEGEEDEEEEKVEEKMVEEEKNKEEEKEKEKDEKEGEAQREEKNEEEEEKEETVKEKEEETDIEEKIEEKKGDATCQG